MKFSVIKIDLYNFFDHTFVTTYANVHRISLDKFQPSEIIKLKNDGVRFIYWDLNSNSILFMIRNEQYDLFLKGDEVDLSIMFNHPPGSILTRIVELAPLGSIDYDYDDILNKYLFEGFESLDHGEVKFLKMLIENEYILEFYNNFNTEELNKELKIELKCENYEKASIIQDIINNKNEI